MTLDYHSNASINAGNYIISKYGIFTKSLFEKEFHCKIIDNRIQFNYIRDYTWFILKWS